MKKSDLSLIINKLSIKVLLSIRFIVKISIILIEINLKKVQHEILLVLVEGFGLFFFN